MGDIIVFVYHVILVDHVIKVLNDFMGKSPFKVCHHPTKYDGHRHCGSKAITVLVCDVI